MPDLSLLTNDKSKGRQWGRQSSISHFLRGVQWLFNKAFNRPFGQGWTPPKARVLWGCFEGSFDARNQSTKARAFLRR